MLQETLRSTKLWWARTTLVREKLKLSINYLVYLVFFSPYIQEKINMYNDKEFGTYGLDKYMIKVITTQLYLYVCYVA